MYHLYEPDEVNSAIDEAIRVTKPGGVMLFAFISMFAIMYADYFYGNWAEGQAMNFTEEYKIRHFKEQPGFSISDEDFKAFAKWYLAFSEKRELLGATNHLLYICRKKA